MLSVFFVYLAINNYGMAILNLSFSVGFSVLESNSYFVFTDKTNYSGQGITETNVVGILKVTTPNGVTYNNTDFGSPDLDLSTSRVSGNINIPTVFGTQAPLPGQYVFQYTASDDSGATSSVATKEFTYSLTELVAQLGIEVDCISPLLKSEDTTSYNQNGINPDGNLTISTVSTGDNTISLSGDKVALFQVGNKFNITASTGNDGQYTVTGVNYDYATTTTVVSVASIVDATADGLVASKSNAIYYPSVKGLDPLIGFTTTTSTGSFYTGNQEFKLEGNVFYNLTNDVYISFYLKKTESKDISCDTRLCDIYCCIGNTLQRYLNTKGVNDVLSARYKEAYVLASSHLISMQTKLKCGNSSDLDTLVAEIRKITECTPDCDCSGTESTLVQGVGLSSNINVTSSGNGITVATVVTGNETTFVLSLDGAIINGLSNTVTTLVDSANVLVNEVVDGQGNKTYTPTIVSGLIPTVGEKMSFNLKVDFRFGSPSFNVRSAVDFTIANVTYDAQDDYVSPTVEDTSILVFSEYPLSTNLFTVKDFQGSSDAYKVSAEVTGFESYNSNDNTISLSSDYDISEFISVSIVKKISTGYTFILGTGDITSPTQDYINKNFKSITINFIITK